MGFLFPWPYNRQRDYRHLAGERGKRMRIGILGCGAIAKKMAKTIVSMEKEDVHLAAFASRSLDKALAYKEEFQAEKAYGSYEEMARDDSIDLIYIATPHSEHFGNIRLCLFHHRNVLCEKPFTVNEKQAGEAIELARKYDCLLAEAMWTRYMPMQRKIQEILDSGKIGKIRFLTADLGYAIHDKKRLVDPLLAGGTLLDVGIYPLDFALMHMPSKIIGIQAFCNKTTTGVDMSEGILLTHEDTSFSSLTATMECATPRMATISGTEGYLLVENVNNPERIEVRDKNHNHIEVIEKEKDLGGYEYEIRECQKALLEKKTECPSMPWKDTLSRMALLDKIRALLGVHYSLIN